MTQLRATKADIEAILQARKQAAIEQANQVAIPALPQKKIPTPETAAVIAQSITQPASLPSVQAAPSTVVSDKDVERFLEDHLPMLIKAAQDLVTPPFNLMEVVQLGTAVSQAVAAGLPQIKGAEARALVVVLVRYLWRKHATPLLPASVKPFAGMLETLIVMGVEAAYQLVVKRKVQS
ncbi:hypothetical protein [Deinococcus enclensis]|uniref:DUF697 domain-containing protein n=1 Tax=Deinococcus enclensis TaxID=1049582 RepID=A0ABT9MB74_9DEIO|nr:hypothetical protein [Deinococcus enclensis]MDP9763827.1 hypothetical protein [Deinococcus enclensis]